MRGAPFAAAVQQARVNNASVPSGMNFRFEFAEPDAETLDTQGHDVSDGYGKAAPEGLSSPVIHCNARRDLDMVEDLLDRCWREVDTTALNVKLADIVRLLEFKNKLRSATDAQETFWSIINDLRREELGRFGDVTCSSQADSQQDPDDSQT